MCTALPWDDYFQEKYETILRARTLTISQASAAKRKAARVVKVEFFRQ